MRESITLIEHPIVTLDQLRTKKNVDIYSSKHLITIPRQVKQSRSDNKLLLPPIDKDDQRTRKKSKRPIYRTSLYHPNSTLHNHVDLTPLTGRGTKHDRIQIIRDDDTVRNLQRHHAPPPSPSDDQLERIFSDLNRTRLSTPRSDIDTDGYVPYRLPALNQPVRQRSTAVQIKSTLSNYLQIYY